MNRLIEDSDEYAAATGVLLEVEADCTDVATTRDDPSSDDHSDDIAELTAAVDAAMERTGAPGMEVA